MTELDPRHHDGDSDARHDDASADESHLIVVGRAIPPPSEVNDLIVGVTAVLAAVCGLVFGVTIVLGTGVALPGTALAVGLFSLAVAVRRYFAAAYPDIEGAEPRESPESPDAAQSPETIEAESESAEEEAIAEVVPVGRRTLLQRLLIAGTALFGVGLAAPVTSLGPSPGGDLRSTEWAAGRRLLTGEGEPIRPEDVPVGGVAATIWPEGAIRVESAAVILLRLSSEPQAPTNLDWVVEDELVAYSKVCTHAGCPVSLFREQDNALFCPCHQSTFDAARGAVPTFGPTARALPQLPLGVDEDGFLVALGDFPDQVGPAFG